MADALPAVARDYPGLAFQGVGIVVALIAAGTPFYLSLQSQLTDEREARAALSQRVTSLEERESRDFTVIQSYISGTSTKLDDMTKVLQDLSTQMRDLRQELKK